MRKITNNYQETIKLGIDFAKKLTAEDTVLLYGELGAGKTTFVQGVAQGFGIKDRIISPTFVLQRIHEVNNEKIKRMNHIDLYRIDKPTKSDSLGLTDLFEDEESITLIEWAERLKEFKPRKGYIIKIKYLGDEERQIDISNI